MARPGEAPLGELLLSAPDTTRCSAARLVAAKATLHLMCFRSRLSVSFGLVWGVVALEVATAVVIYEWCVLFAERLEWADWLLRARSATRYALFL